MSVEVSHVLMLVGIVLLLVALWLDSPM